MVLRCQAIAEITSHWSDCSGLAGWYMHSVLLLADAGHSMSGALRTAFPSPPKYSCITGVIAIVLPRRQAGFGERRPLMRPLCFSGGLASHIV
ncbi:hypothetical protein HYPSUDRAFT_818669 [Hypholoma sublateritium FD-334 SS-4]|uniref:Uncharacterized protein n=1 Tax=Hypholoma sublateritium (strain FD-334 SS-4) TaxID=945553 RepID=A0A0D2N794_HYPSF|nr:hypothetical protein HYPSUDRAFT_818669 [Hypholoma sublateritium FD-334 SS-4]